MKELLYYRAIGAAPPDTRDLRDPIAIGLAIHKANRSHGLSIKEAADDIYSGSWKNFPEVSKDDSMGKACVREYRSELQARADQGDKYALSALESIDAGKGVQGYDDSGA